MKLTYILPIRRAEPDCSVELGNYLAYIAEHAQVVVVDGSDPSVFRAHAVNWGRSVQHIPIDPDLRTPNGKVGGVLTGLRRAHHEHIVIADDDVRYDLPALERMSHLLTTADVVRPQNYFLELPWHVRLDTARTLLNRVSGGDWPGTLGVRRQVMRRTGGYRGDVLFENLELVRTVQAAGGTELLALDLLVGRHAPTTHHFWSQRIRQAYDEWARPRRLVFQLALLPMLVGLAVRRQWAQIGLLAMLASAVAEAGRRRGGGRRVFPWTSSLLAPVWLLERGVCSWLAVGMYVLHGGVPYRGTVLRTAATPLPVLRAQLQNQKAVSTGMMEPNGQMRAREPVVA